MSHIIKGNWDETIKNMADFNTNMGIGTYKEKTLHNVIKHYFEPDTQFHEMPWGKKIADISNEFGIIEIQTRSFDNLREKLKYFLPENNVTVVYPYAKIKWMSWLDPKTGEISKRRKSPKKQSVFDAFYELYKIKMFLNHKNLNLFLIGLELDEVRLLDGWSYDGKKGSTRYDRYPIEILETVYIKNMQDYLQFLPEDIPYPFTNEDLARCCKISIETASKATNCLCSTGVLQVVGKNGRKNLYNII